MSKRSEQDGSSLELIWLPMDGLRLVDDKMVNGDELGIGLMLSAYLSLIWIQRTSLDGFGEDIDLSTI